MKVCDRCIDKKQCKFEVTISTNPYHNSLTRSKVDLCNGCAAMMGELFIKFMENPSLDALAILVKEKS